MLMSWTVTRSSCLIWQIISFILPLNEYACVWAWPTLGNGPALDLQKMPILTRKNHLFRWGSFWSWRVYKQAKLPHLGHRKPVCIHWKSDAPKISYCLMRILIQGHNWAIFLRKWTRTGRYSLGDRYRAMMNEVLFTKMKRRIVA